MPNSNIRFGSQAEVAQPVYYRPLYSSKQIFSRLQVGLAPPASIPSYGLLCGYTPAFTVVQFGV